MAGLCLVCGSPWLCEMSAWQVRGIKQQVCDAMLKANGFPEAADWIYQTRVRKELKNIADPVRKQAVGLLTGRAD
jgi:hypothetical protein